MVAVLASFSRNCIPFSFPSLPSVSTSKPFNPDHPSHLRRSSAHHRAPFRGDTLRFHGHGSPAGTLPIRRLLLLRRWSSADEESPGGPTLPEEGPVDRVNGGGGDGGEDWTTSVLLFVLWAGLMYYVFQLTPDQTPSRDMYFLQKLLNLKGDDGFRMNQVLVALWYIMGLWPLVYSMLLLPSGRSSRSKVPVWPFLVVSFFAGAYGLIPYFVLWKPPPPPFEEEEIQSWPLNFLESKITAAILTAAGLGLILYAGLAPGDEWTEFYQYFRESKFIHLTSLDFLLLSSFSGFWVYNDMTARKWFDEGSWLLPFALVPFMGPALYLLLRPPLSAIVAPVWGWKPPGAVAILRPNPKQIGFKLSSTITQAQIFNRVILDIEHRFDDTEWYGAILFCQSHFNRLIQSLMVGNERGKMESK
ncbi:hypothetical protein Taro_051458, partial [Colocasia esculenta]|nr:hypothetical protein [Colocasia esculenta]